MEFLFSLSLAQPACFLTPRHISLFPAKPSATSSFPSLAWAATPWPSNIVSFLYHVSEPDTAFATTESPPSTPLAMLAKPNRLIRTRCLPRAVPISSFGATAAIASC